MLLLSSSLLPQTSLPRPPPLTSLLPSPPVNCVQLRTVSSLTREVDTRLVTSYTVENSGAICVAASFTYTSRPGSADGIVRHIWDQGAVMLECQPSGSYVDVEMDLVRARWPDTGAWQQLMLRIGKSLDREMMQQDGAADESALTGGRLRYGDAISLAAHTGRYLSAPSNGTREAELLAREQRNGEFGPIPPTDDQLFIVERAGGESSRMEGDGEGLGDLVHRSAVVWLRCAGASAAHGTALYVSVGEGGQHSLRLSTTPCEWKLHIGESPPPLRLGFELALTRQMAEGVEWYGRGPHESYCDRWRGARLGLWSGSVSEQTFRYVRPQENGNKFETRWM